MPNSYLQHTCILPFRPGSTVLTARGRLGIVSQNADSTRCGAGPYAAGGCEHAREQGPQEVPMFAYVHHVGMIVPNIDEAMDLFQNKLRLKLLRRETVASSNINWRSSLPERLT
jgi:hypothetical protein